MVEVNHREFQISVLSIYSILILFHYEKLTSYLDQYQFTIGNTKNFGTYINGGTVKEVKKPTTIEFVSTLQRSVKTYQELS